jgi:hypothetical protein
MNVSVTKVGVPYEVIEVGEELIGIGLADRLGRRPIQGVKISAAGEVEITGSDGVIEVLGGPGEIAPENVIRKARQHHEGLLVVFFGDIGPVGEQVVKASFYK